MRSLRRGSSAAAAAGPALVTVYLAFDAGGFFPQTIGVLAVVLAVLIAARALLADDPFAGFDASLVLVSVALCLYALWALVSAAWSDAPVRSLTEFDRALLYLLAMVLFAPLLRTPERLRAALALLTAAIVAICVVSLTTRLLPAVWPIGANRGQGDEILSYPVTYANALGLLFVLGILLCFWLASSEQGHRVVPVAAAAAIPMLAAAVSLTLARGAVAAGAAGAVAYVALARPRLAIDGFLAVAAPAAGAIAFASLADVVPGSEPGTGGSVRHGAVVAVAIVACCVAAGLIRSALLARPIGLPALASRRLILAAVAVAAVALAAVLGLGGAHALRGQYDQFVHGDRVSSAGLRGGFLDASSNGRLPFWRAALRGFEQAPLEGRGADTYALTWDRYREGPTEARNAHSLYLETLAELGLVGLLLLGVAIGGLLLGLLLRARRRTDDLAAILFAAGLAWALHAALDWDWELPVVTLWLFALGGAGLAVAEPGRPRLASIGSRLALAAAVLAAAVPAGLAAVSETRLDSAAAAFRRHDCAAASRAARSSLAVLSLRPEPHELLGYCALRRGDPRVAVTELARAVDRDPQNWAYHYGLALARAAAGLDPRAEARRALELDPREPLARESYARLSDRNRRHWRRLGQTLAARLISL